MFASKNRSEAQRSDCSQLENSTSSVEIVRRDDDLRFLKKASQKMSLARPEEYL
jgi:hypothetical protein